MKNLITTLLATTDEHNRILYFVNYAGMQDDDKAITLRFDPPRELLTDTPVSRFDKLLRDLKKTIAPELRLASRCGEEQRSKELAIHGLTHGLSFMGTLPDGEWLNRRMMEFFLHGMDIAITRRSFRELRTKDLKEMHPYVLGTPPNERLLDLVTPVSVDVIAGQDDNYPLLGMQNTRLADEVCYLINSYMDMHSVLKNYNTYVQGTVREAWQAIQTDFHELPSYTANQELIQKCQEYGNTTQNQRDLRLVIEIVQDGERFNALQQMANTIWRITKSHNEGRVMGEFPRKFEEAFLPTSSIKRLTYFRIAANAAAALYEAAHGNNFEIVPGSVMYMERQNRR
jgi:hypothetical protein